VEVGVGAAGGARSGANWWVGHCSNVCSSRVGVRSISGMEYLVEKMS